MLTNSRGIWLSLEQWGKADQMAAEDCLRRRSWFFRWLVEQEWERRLRVKGVQMLLKDSRRPTA